MRPSFIAKVYSLLCFHHLLLIHKRSKSSFPTSQKPLQKQSRFGPPVSQKKRNLKLNLKHWLCRYVLLESVTWRGALCLCLETETTFSCQFRSITTTVTKPFSDQHPKRIWTKFEAVLLGFFLKRRRGPIYRRDINNNAHQIFPRNKQSI
jgi:hypothetical protein